MVRNFAFIVFISVWAAMSSSCFAPNTGGGEFGYANNRIQLETVDDLYRFLTYNETRYPLISAHRGGPTEGFPENAIETFENNLRIQPVIIECDVRMTRDSSLVLMHDETVDRTTTGEGRVSQFDLSELKKLWLTDPEGQETSYHIPTLDEALRWGAGKVIFTIDVKRDVPYAAVIDAIRRNRAEAYSVIITYRANQVVAVHRRAPDLMISASIRSQTDLLRLSSSNVPDNRLIAFVGTSEPDEQVYELLHDHGILCILGTMGNLDKRATTRGDTLYTGLVERGADILSTDRPIEAGKLLEDYRRANNITSRYTDSK